MCWYVFYVVSFFFLMIRPPPGSTRPDTLFPYTTLFRSSTCLQVADGDNVDALVEAALPQLLRLQAIACPPGLPAYDRTLLMRELGLFREWFLRRHLGVALAADEDADFGGIESLPAAAAGSDEHTPALQSPMRLPS